MTRSDLAVVALAAATVLAARLALPVPWWVAATVVVVALARRRPVWVAAAVVLVASSAADRAWAAMADPPAGPVAGPAVLVSDPVARRAGVAVVARLGDHQVELVAYGRAAAPLRARSAGQRVVVTGRARPVEGRPWLTVRHVASRVEVASVAGWDDGDLPARAANAVRGVVERGAEPLPGDRRALYLGFVLGDDRAQPPELAADFDAAGLTHLLAVSGQNVALVLVAAGPLLRRLGLRGRLVATVGLLVGFALLTRFEPSVLRATAMAGLGATAVVLGRPVAGLRVLALAVIGLVLIDPFLVHRLGFALSVGASAGILVLARPLADLLPGPAWCTRPAAVTVAAQAGVAPVAIPAFGGLPVASLPANLLAGPASGLVMVWGCTGGLLAGLVPAVAPVLQAPTGVVLGFVQGVAAWSAALPLGRVGPVAAGALAAALTAAGLARRQRRPGLALVALVLAAAVVAAPTLQGPVPGVGPTPLEGEGVLWRGAGPDAATVLVLHPGADPRRTLGALRAQRVRRLDLVVAASPSATQGLAVATVLRRLPVGAVWKPTGGRIPRADTPEAGSRWHHGGLVVTVAGVAPGLDVEVQPVR